MALIKKLIDIENVFITVDRKVILNDIKLTDEKIEDLIYHVTDEKISLIPQCECGHVKYGYKIGKVCPLCNTTVVRPFDNIDPFLWIRQYDPNIRFVNPKFWIMLSRVISTKIDALLWLSDTSYNPPKPPAILQSLAVIIGGRSYSNVVNNMEKIILFIKNHSSYKTMIRRIKMNIILKLYKKNKDILFPRYLPLINKKLFISEKSKDGRWDTMLLADIIDIAMLAITLANEDNPTPKRIDKVYARLVSHSGKLYASYIKDMVSRKGGLARKNIYGTRAHFTFRGVISSLAVHDDYDVLHVPWVVGVATFRPHLLNKLYKLGYVHKEASDIVFKATKKYNPLIDKLLQELIDESPCKGIPVTFNRNPSLGKSSIQLLYITKFMTNLEIKTIFLSLHIMPGFNADLDGDEMHGMLLPDNHIYKLAKIFEPHYNAASLSPYKISGNINIPKTQCLTLANYLNKDLPEVDLCDIYNELLELDKE